MSTGRTSIPFLFGLLLLLGACPAIRGEAYLELTGADGTVIIEGDTTKAGRLTGPMDPGVYHLNYLPIQHGAAWETPLLSFALHLTGDETLHVELDRMSTVRLETQPAGGEVYRDDTWIGRTPLYLATLAGYPDTLTIKKAGYLTTGISLTQFSGIEQERNTYHVKLLPIESTGYQGSSTASIGGGGTGTYIKYMTLAATITTMSLGFWYKSRADSYYEDYLTRGDPDEIEKLYNRSIELDDRARVFWIAGEVGALLTSYLFVKEYLFPPDNKNITIQE